MFRRLLCLMAIIGLCPPCAQARPYYVGPRGSLLWHNDSGMGNPVNVGALAGAQIRSTRVGLFFVETDFGASLKSGEIERPGGTWEIQWVRLHATYRTSGRLFFKGKFGAAVAWITSTAYGTLANDADFGSGGGVGVGWWFTPAATLELEYEPLANLRVGSEINGRVDMITLQLTYWFGAP
jgi:hypothetical protein